MGLSRPVMEELYLLFPLILLTVGQSHIYITYYLYPTNLLNTADKYEFTILNPTNRTAIKHSMNMAYITNLSPSSHLSKDTCISFFMKPAIVLAHVLYMNYLPVLLMYYSVNSEDVTV